MTVTTTDPAAVPALGNTPSAPVNPADKRADEFVDYPRDQWGRPLIILLDPDGQPQRDQRSGEFIRAPYVRASTAGGALEYEGALNSWRIRQTVIGLIARADLFALAQAVDEPGTKGRTEMDEVIKRAQEAGGSGTAANLGTAGHAFAEKHDRGQSIPHLEPPFSTWLDAYRALTKGWTWHAIECRLICDELRMAGRTDRIGSPPGYMIAPDGTIIGPEDRVVVDIKTSSSAKYFGVKFAVQLAVYGHGSLYDLDTGQRTPTGVRTDWALVVHIPSGASSGALYWVDIRSGLALGHLARQVLDARSRRDLCPPVGPRVFATLDEAVAAGGRLDPASPERAAAIDVEPIGTAPAPHPTAGQNPADPATWRPDLATRLQAQGDPARQLELELAAVRDAAPRGGLDAVRARFAASWGDAHERAAVLRAWELEVIEALGSAPDRATLRAIWAQVNQWDRWTPEMQRVGDHRATALGHDE